MGGGGDVHHHGADGDFRTKVWSMTGGPYCRPKHWKRNTAIAMFGIFLVCIPIAMKSAELEVIFHLPNLLLILDMILNLFNSKTFLDSPTSELGHPLYYLVCNYYRPWEIFLQMLDLFPRSAEKGYMLNATGICMSLWWLRVYYLVNATDIRVCIS